MIIVIIDVVLCDVYQFLFVICLCFDDMLLIVVVFDDVGYGLLECWGGVIFDVCICFFGEDLWLCLCEFKKVMLKIFLQMLLCGQNLFGYCYYVDDVVECFVECVVKNGMDVFCVFDVMNDLCNMKVVLQVVCSYGVYVQGIFFYIISLVYILQIWLDLME